MYVVGYRLHLKQPRYPVLYLTCGINDLWPVYRDVRQRTFTSSIAFAKSEWLLVQLQQHKVPCPVLTVVMLSGCMQGLSALSSPLLSDPSVGKMILDSGLILFTWGDDNNEAGNIAKLKKAGVHAVVYDRYVALSV